MDVLKGRTTKLSLAVFLRDDYSGGRSIGKVNVSLKEGAEKPIKNPGSYYLFLNLPGDTYTVRVMSNHYFAEESGTIDIAELGPADPVVSITLKPDPSYPFPPGATLIRGMVYDSEGKSVSGARVSVLGIDTWNKTTEQGEFVLYSGELTEDKSITDGGKMFVEGDNDSKIVHLEVEYRGVTKTTELKVKEGKTTSVVIHSISESTRIHKNIESAQTKPLLPFRE